MKKGIFILIFILFLNMTMAYGDESEIVVTLNDEVMILEEPAYIIGDRTLLPLRYILEPLGLEVSWNAKTRTVIAKKNELLIEMPIGSKKVKINNELFMIDVPAMIINNRTYIPVSFIVKATGSIVKWDDESRTVSIYTEDASKSIEDSVGNILVRIFNYSKKNDFKNSFEIREDYHSLIIKLEKIRKIRKEEIGIVKNALVDLGDSFGVSLLNEKDFNELLIELEPAIQKYLDDSIKNIKLKYNFRITDNGDKVYKSEIDTDDSLYEFKNGIIRIGTLLNSGYATIMSNNGFSYGMYVNQLKSGYHYEAHRLDSTIKYSVSFYNNGILDGIRYEVAYSNENIFKYSLSQMYKDGIAVDIAYLIFPDGVERLDRSELGSKSKIARLDKNKILTIYPTDSKGYSREQNTGFGYKQFESGVEYIGDFFEGSIYGNGLYYEADESSNLASNLMDLRATEIIEQIIIKEQTDEEKIKSIYSYLASHILYDTIPNANGDYKSMSHTAYSALVDGVAVCDGYSEAFKYLLDKVEIENVLIFGEAKEEALKFKNTINHAWNLIKVGDKYYHYDLTWDDDDINNKVRYNFYKKEDEDLSNTHKWKIIDYSKYLTN